ncbi:PilZ domain-containing protein [Aliivibrio kagoshimensis]|uniref:PilZ domain-containing protein n=1 Tax=Aliivibrio kagoshimensis TaxID=2910230 RepID=UPI003D1401DB
MLSEKMPQEDYQFIIEQLIPAFGSDDFELTLSHMTDGEHPSVRLLVKMELKRLMAPCKRRIDLRGRVQGDCREYVMDGFSHWLDDVAFNTYHKSINKYGSYTVGVWEDLVNTRNNFRVMHAQNKFAPTKAPKEDKSFDVNFIRFGHYLTRKENRLQISTQVEITLPKKQEIHGISSDLSPSGAKIKVPTAFDYGLGQIVEISFPALSKETGLAALNHKLEYRIIGIDDCNQSDSFKWLRIKLESDPEIIHQAIDIKLKGTRRKARHDNQDKILATRTKAYEYSYLKNSTHLPLFFAGNEMKYAMLSDNNQELWHYWHDEKNQPVLKQLLNEERMSNLTKPGLQFSRTFIYCFYHEFKKRKLFYSMATPEASYEERQLFWHFGAKRDNWKVLKLSVYELNSSDIEHLQSVAPEMDDDEKHLTHMGIIQEISLPETQEDFLAGTSFGSATKELEKYRHPFSDKCKAKALILNLKSHRCEPRFFYDTPIMISHPDFGTIEANSIDFSARGLNIQTQKPVPLHYNQEVKISFPQFQKQHKSVALTSIPYTIKRLSPDSMNVQLINSISDRESKTEAFLQRLIKHNLNKLTHDYENYPSVEFVESLNKMILSKLDSVPFFIEKNGYRILPRAIAGNFPLMPIYKLFKKRCSDNIFTAEHIFNSKNKHLISDSLKKCAPSKPCLTEMYVAVSIMDDQVTAIKAKLLSDFDSIEERVQFIQIAKDVGEFFALRISISTIQSAATALIEKEINELAQGSMHHAVSVENEFTSLVGSGEIYDITDEVLIRLEQS